MEPIVMLILDGAGDTLGSQSYNETPLGVATKPALDWLAAKGQAGVLYPIDIGIEPETHSGMLNLLGYAVLPHQVPRGPIEALGCGLDVKAHDLVLRVNFGTRDEQTGQIIDRRVCGSLKANEASALCEDIMKGLNQVGTPYQVMMKVIRNYRACAVIRSEVMTFSDKISNTDPGYPTENVKVVKQQGYEPCQCYPMDATEASSDSAAMVNDFVHRAEQILTTHEANLARRSIGAPVANCILTRGPGCGLPNLDHIEARFGVPFTLYADLPIERGVGQLVSCTVCDYEVGVSRSESYRQLSRTIAKNIKGSSVTVVHVKGPDEFGHLGDFEGKRRCIEEIDEAMLVPLIKELSEKVIFVVTSDHATPCHAGRHSDDPVPFVVAGPRIESNGASRFSEASCTGLPGSVKKGPDLLPFVINKLEK